MSPILGDSAALMKETGIDEQETQTIMEDLCQLQRKYLNIKYSPMNQVASLKLIGNDLKVRYPHIFAGESGRKCLYFAIHGIMKIHGRRRFHKTLNMRKARVQPIGGTAYNKKPASENSRTVAGGESSNSTSVSKEVSTGSQRSAPHVLGTRSQKKKHHSCIHTPQQCGPDTLNLDHTHPGPGDALNPDPANADRSHSDISASHLPIDQDHISPGSSRIGSRAPRSTPLLVEGTHHASRQDNSRTPYGSEDLDIADVEDSMEIYTFLGTCLPPMNKYLQQFTSFGCTSSTYLHSISQWRPEQRYILLKKILESGPQGAVHPEIDIAVIENQFATYFNEE
ncbi:hypothetical protein BDN70DRAFT_932113 [Pholiota conissans]|uniref:Uncharacterized protein n=1 Tax=Pholiota conissans TaxID=109636 RepID=A0A9P5Z4C7_9AGAR|nr:hypothetical protein BDN70DRAFT_932113 [Pholiota conissans]